MRLRAEPRREGPAPVHARAVSVTAEGRALYAHARRALKSCSPPKMRSSPDWMDWKARDPCGDARRCLQPKHPCQASRASLEANPEVRLGDTGREHARRPDRRWFRRRDTRRPCKGQPPGGPSPAHRLMVTGPQHHATCRLASPPQGPSDLAERMCLRIAAHPLQNEWRLIDQKATSRAFVSCGNSKQMTAASWRTPCTRVGHRYPPGEGTGGCGRGGNVGAMFCPATASAAWRCMRSCPKGRQAGARDALSDFIADC